MSNKTKIFSRFIPRLALESGPKHLEEKMQIVMAIPSFVVYIRKLVHSSQLKNKTHLISWERPHIKLF